MKGDNIIRYKTLSIQQDGRGLLNGEISHETDRKGTIAITELPKTLDLQTVRLFDLSDQPISVVSRSFDEIKAFTLSSLKDRKITVIKHDKTAVGYLVASSDNMIIMTDLAPDDTKRGQIIEIQNPDIIMAEGTRPKTQLNLTLDPSSLLEVIKAAELRVLFQASGFSWDAVYQLDLDLTKNFLKSLVCEVSCQNKSGLDLSDVELSLVSKSDDRSYRERSYAPTMAMMAQAAPPRGRETVLGTTIYTLPNPVTLLNQNTTILKLFEVKEQPLVKVLSYHLLRGDKHPETMVQFTLPKIPLAGSAKNLAYPGGRALFWENDTLLTEDRMEMTTSSTPVTFNLGENGYISIKKEVVSSEVKNGRMREEAQIITLQITAVVYNRSSQMVFLDFFVQYEESFRNKTSTTKVSLPLLRTPQFS